MMSSLTQPSHQYSRAQLQELALAYLAKNKLMSIATSHQDQPWAATTFFAYTAELELLFFSRPDTQHCTNIAQNPNVAVTINQEWGVPGYVTGIQFSGQATLISEGAMTSSRLPYYSIYRKRYPWADKHPDHQLYLIKPSEVWMIDHKLFGHFFRVQVV